MALSGVAVQTRSDVRLVIADQSREPVSGEPVIQTLLRVVETRGGCIDYHHRPQVHGIAEQRDFLLRQSTADAVLYLDDDVFMEPWVVERLLETLQRQVCGFVGAFPAGLSHLQDFRPEQQRIELWDGPVRPEAVDPGTEAWERYQLHRAANLYHVARRLDVTKTLLYKVAWIASCVMYDRRKLEAVGGFSFWSRLPRYHSGEEVLAQNLLLRRWGGCGIIPAGTYYSQLESTVLNDQGTVDGHALELLPEMIDRYASDSNKELVRVES